MSYIDALKAVTSDPTLQLSPYSELSVIAGRAGLETVVGTTLDGMASASVSEGMQNLVMTAGLAAASSAISSFSSIPFVGAVTSVIGMIIEHELGAKQRKEEALARQAAECTAKASAMRPIPTGAFAELVPADLLAPYLSNNPPGTETPAGAQGRAMTEPAYMPEIGKALWLFGYGYSLPDVYPGMTEDEYQIVSAFATKKASEVRAWETHLNPPGVAGPTQRRRRQFSAVALAIGATRNVRGTDAGIGLWPVLQDILWNTRGATTVEWADFMATTGYWASKGHKPSFQRVNVPECGRVHPGAIRQVAEMRRAWGLTIQPVYAQYQAQADEIRSRVKREMARLMAPLAGVDIGLLRPSFWRSAAALGGLTLGIAAAAQPAVAGATGRAVMSAIGRLVRRPGVR